MPKRDLEGPVVKAITEWAKWQRDLFLWRNNTGMIMLGEGKQRRPFKAGLKGSPDFIGFRKPSGQFIGIECKSPKGRLTKHQREFGERLAAHGGVYIVARSVEDVRKGLE